MPLFSKEPLAGLGRLPAPSVKRHVRELYTPVQTRQLLRRERARADRQMGRFAIVLFQVAGTHSPRLCVRLARTVLNQVRETDEVGYFDDETVCAVLPDTDEVGAAMLVNRVTATIKSHEAPPKFVVFKYPDDESPSDPKGGRRVDGKEDLTGRLANETPAHAAARHDVEEGLITVHSLAEMFSVPMPGWKRALDIAAASFGILMTSPLLIGAALAIKFGSDGPVLFKQNRTGYAGKPFSIYKFRTMVVSAEAQKEALRSKSEQDGPAFKIKDDPRITRVGKWLRKTSLDELPQLFNILKGDMSLVGPRPLPVKEADGCVGWQARRHDVTPGLTCIWQVHGRSRVKFDEWMRMDMRYAQRRQPLKDLFLILKTVPAVLLRRGAN